MRNFVGQQLPEYMVPSTFIALEALPLTPNGKTDRKALPEMDAQAEESKFIPPGTTTEVALAKIWCEVLKLKQASIQDNFFDLGGNSLSAAQVISRLVILEGIEMSLRDVFNFPTIAAMSAWVDKQRVEPVDSALPRLVPLGRRGGRAVRMDSELTTPERKQQ